MYEVTTGTIYGIVTQAAEIIGENLFEREV